MLRYIFYILIFLPALTFGLLPGISSFPWVILLSPFIISKENIVNYFQIFILFTLIFLIQVLLTDFNTFLFFQSVIAILNATLLIPFILNLKTNHFRIITNTMIAYLIASVLMGILQFLFPVVVEFSAFIFGHSSGFGFKGPPSLSYEPSRAALDMIYILLTLIYLNKIKLIKLNKFFTIGIIIFLLLINKSISAYLMLFIYFLLNQLIKSSIKNVLKLSVTIIVFLVIVSFFFQDSNIHAIKSFNRFLASDNKYEVILFLGGHRLVGIISSYESFSLFGYGLGNWATVFNEYANKNYSTIIEIPHYRNVGLKANPPLNFVGRYLIEIGLLGLISFFYLLLPFKQINYSRLKIIFFNSEFLTLIISLFFLSYGSNPILFLCLSLMYYSKFSKPIINNNQK